MAETGGHAPLTRATGLKLLTLATMLAACGGDGAPRDDMLYGGSCDDRHQHHH